MYERRTGRDGKIPARPMQDEVRMQSGGIHITPSLIAQELPYPDRKAWLKEIFAPETSFERAERLQRANSLKNKDLEPKCAG